MLRCTRRILDLSGGDVKHFLCVAADWAVLEIQHVIMDLGWTTG